MQIQDPIGFELHEPHVKKVQRFVLVSLGLHHEWSGDGHNKLMAIRFPVWGMWDKWLGKWLGIWVVSNN